MLDFVDYLVEWARGVPLLALCTARPELLARRPGWGGGKVNSSTILLSALSVDEMTRLVESLLDDSDLERGSSTQLVEHAAGNPLYAEEFTRLLLTGEARSELPETVQGIIAARLDTLPREEKDLLQEAAVFGRVFWLGALGRERWTLEERLHSLERKEFVGRERRSTVAGEAEYVFRHALVRDVAYEQIPKAERAEKHRAVAEWIESLGRPDDHAETIAHHYATAFEYARSTGGSVEPYAERAGTALREAGDRAFALHAFAAGARFYRRALDLSSETDPARGPLLLRLGSSLFRSEGGGESELLAALAALRETDDVEGVTEAELLLADFYSSAGKLELYDRHLASATSLAGELGSSRMKANVLLAISTDASRRGAYEQSLAVARDALTLIDDLDLDELRMRALNLIGWARLQLEDEGGSSTSSDASRSRAHSDHRGRRARMRTSRTTSGTAATFCAQTSTSNEALRLAERFGDVPIGRFLRGIVAHNRYRHGRWDDALEAAESYLEEVGESHNTVWHALGTRGLIRLSRGDDSGIEDSDRSIEAARRSVEPVTLPATLEVRARSLILAGRPEEAAQAIEEALAIMETGIVKAGFDLPQLVFAAVELGVDAQRVLAVARPSKWLEAARHYFAGDFGRAADVYGETGSRTDEAEARFRSGHALLAAGRRSEGEAEMAKSARVLSRGRRDVLHPARRSDAGRSRARDSRVAPARARSPRRAP